MKNQEQSIEIHYIKDKHYRIYHVDGAFGGFTPKGNLHLSLFVERSPIPQKTIHKITEEGNLGEITDRTSKSGIIREMECGLVMNIETAQQIKDWLEDKLNQFEELSAKQSKSE